MPVKHISKNNLFTKMIELYHLEFNVVDEDLYPITYIKAAKYSHKPYVVFHLPKNNDTLVMTINPIEIIKSPISAKSLILDNDVDHITKSLIFTNILNTTDSLVSYVLEEIHSILPKIVHPVTKNKYNENKINELDLLLIDKILSGMIKHIPNLLYLAIKLTDYSDTIKLFIHTDKSRPTMLN